MSRCSRPPCRRPPGTTSGSARQMPRRGLTWYRTVFTSVSHSLVLPAPSGAIKRRSLRLLAIRAPTCIAAAKTSPNPSPKSEACQSFIRSDLPARTACRRSWLNATTSLLIRGRAGNGFTDDRSWLVDCHLEQGFLLLRWRPRAYASDPCHEVSRTGYATMSA
jgi:hypothetical protein